ncbi:hypothetical protein IQ235_07900 [Oscillatoriales cyanobacterium LEGE 11467]|uniref:Uncharacterized protein n=1 Tax=Zarconia navalis LEGE 11467 TaxID=1828826 RepID=A0A928VV37_9CYAN|nr:hypothetical protein [Zarconia navalis]MBE9040701.1 hypothetical protein [Zarconia navalis LEGE 11467]
MTNNSLTHLKSDLEAQVKIRRQLHRYPEWKYCGFAELVLDLGQPMTAVPLPPYLDLGLPKYCYRNAQQLAFKHTTLTYVEGFALSSDDLPIAMPHAWLANDKGEAIELTWEAPGTAYLGIPLETQWVKSFLKQRKCKDELSIFNGNYLEEFSLLKDDIPQEAIAS